MTYVTLDAIKAEQLRLADLIASFEAQTKIARAINIPEADIDLLEGEHYAGIILSAKGLPIHHLILISGEAENIKWKDALEWAANAGGELPTRQEQAQLYANLKPQFKGAWYWSNEQHAGYEACAWCQGFYDGNQISHHKNYGLRARAVRRLAIS